MPQTDHSKDTVVAIKTYFTGKAFSCSHGYCFQIGFVEMKIQRVLENNTNPFTCSKSDGTESIIIPSENLKGQGKGLLLNFEYGAPSMAIHYNIFNNYSLSQSEL